MAQAHKILNALQDISLKSHQGLDGQSHQKPVLVCHAIELRLFLKALTMEPYL